MARAFSSRSLRSARSVLTASWKSILSLSSLSSTMRSTTRSTVLVTITGFSTSTTFSMTLVTITVLTTSTGFSTTTSFTTSLMAAGSEAGAGPDAGAGSDAGIGASSGAASSSPSSLSALSTSLWFSSENANSRMDAPLRFLLDACRSKTSMAATITVRQRVKILFIVSIISYFRRDCKNHFSISSLPPATRGASFRPAPPEFRATGKAPSGWSRWCRGKPR